MKSSMALIAAALLFTGSAPVLAQGRGNGQTNKPQTPAHTTGKPAPATGGSNHPANPKSNGGGNPHKTSPTTTATQPTTTAANAPTTTTTTTTTTSTTVTTTTPTTVKNPKLEQRLQALLPGMSVTDASQGFKNWGQFVAAVHVSNNLGIPFTSLKTKMTGPAPMSLGQAIQSLKPAGTTTAGTTTAAGTTTRINSEVRKAESEADEDLRVARNDHRR